MVPSIGEATFMLHCKAYGFTPEAEFQFHPTRKWRFDFAFIDQKLAVEIHGATWVQGRHTTGQGFQKDCEKFSEAAVLGWRIIHVTTDQAVNGTAIDLVRRVRKK